MPIYHQLTNLHPQSDAVILLVEPLVVRDPILAVDETTVSHHSSAHYPRSTAPLPLQPHPAPCIACPGEGRHTPLRKCDSEFGGRRVACDRGGERCLCARLPKGRQNGVMQMMQNHRAMTNGIPNLILIIYIRTTNLACFIAPHRRTRITRRCRSTSRQ